MCGSPTPGTVVPKNGLGTGFGPTKEQEPYVHQNLITGNIFTYLELYMLLLLF